MTFTVIPQLVLTTVSLVSVGLASASLHDVCGAVEESLGTQHPVLLVLRPPQSRTLRPRECVCQLSSSQTFNLSLLLAVSTGDELSSGSLSIRVGNETFNSSGVKEGQTVFDTSHYLKNSSPCNAATDNATTDNATSAMLLPAKVSCQNVTFHQTGTVQRVFLFALTSASPSDTAESLTIKCSEKDGGIGGTTEMPSSVSDMTPASTTANQSEVLMQSVRDHYTWLSTASIVTMALAALVLGLTLLLAHLHYNRRSERRALRKQRRQRMLRKGGSVSGRMSELGTPARGRHSVGSNISSDVFTGEEDATVSGSPPSVHRGGHHSTGGKDLPSTSTPPPMERSPSASVESNSSAPAPRDGRIFSHDPRNQARIPSPSIQKRPLSVLPALPPSTGSPLPEKEQDDEWYGNLEVENTLQKKSSSLDNVYEDPDEARHAAANTTRTVTKPSVKVVPLKVKGKRVEQEKKERTGQGQDLSKITESRVKTASQGTGQGVEADAAQQPRPRPRARTPQSPSNQALLPLQNVSRKPGGLNVARRASEELLTTPTTPTTRTNAKSAVPFGHIEEGRHGRPATPTSSRDSSPIGRSQMGNWDSLGSSMGEGGAALSLLFPESGRTSRASSNNPGETMEMTLVENEEKEEVYQNYNAEQQADTQEKKQQEAASSSRPSQNTVVLIDNELYEPSTPRLGSSNTDAENVSALSTRNQLFSLGSPPAQAAGTTTPLSARTSGQPDKSYLEDNILYESSTNFHADS